MTPDPADLTDVDTARMWVGLPALPDGGEDVAMQLAITAVSQRMASWCSRSLAAATFDEVYDGSGSRRLMLRNYPILGISSLTIDGRPVAASVSPGGPGYRHDRRRTVILDGDLFRRNVGNVEIAYTAGFEQIPADLAMACLDWLKAAYAMRDAGGDIKSRKAGDTAEVYANAVVVGGKLVPMPPSVFATLSQYQNTLPV